MKKIKLFRGAALVLALLFMLTAAGCAKEPESQTEGVNMASGESEENQDGQTAYESQEPEDHVSLAEKVQEREYTAKDGTVIQNLKITYPVVEGEGEPASRINAAIKESVDRYAAVADQSAQMLLEDDTYKDMGSAMYGFESTYQISYNQRGFLCIRITGYDFMGGAHGSPWEEDLIFDLADGRRLGAEDVFTGEEAVRETVIAAFSEQIEKDPDNFFEDAGETLEGTAGLGTPFYLADDGVHFYYAPYELAPYAAGFVEAVAPYDEKLVKLPLF